MPDPPTGVECPYMEAARGGHWRQSRRAGPAVRQGPALSRLETLEVLRGNACAIAPSHQHAILGLAQIRDAHREPNSDCRQRDGEGEGGNVCEHAMAKIIRLVAVALALQIVR